MLVFGAGVYTPHQGRGKKTEPACNPRPFPALTFGDLFPETLFKTTNLTSLVKSKKLAETNISPENGMVWNTFSFPFGGANKKAYFQWLFAVGFRGNLTSAAPVFSFSTSSAFFKA